MNPATGSYPLSEAALSAFAATTDTARCRAFYEGTLGLRFVSEDPFGIVLDSGGVLIRMQKVPGHTPPAFTALGWNVADVEASVRGLASVGINTERFGLFKQDDLGIATFPGGARVAWFKDPDGNILSVAQPVFPNS